MSVHLFDIKRMCWVSNQFLIEVVSCLKLIDDWSPSFQDSPSRWCFPKSKNRMRTQPSCMVLPYMMFDFSYLAHHHKSTLCAHLHVVIARCSALIENGIAIWNQPTESIVCIFFCKYFFRLFTPPFLSQDFFHFLLSRKLLWLTWEISFLPLNM